VNLNCHTCQTIRWATTDAPHIPNLQTSHQRMLWQSRWPYTCLPAGASDKLTTQSYKDHLAFATALNARALILHQRLSSSASMPAEHTLRFTSVAQHLSRCYSPYTLLQLQQHNNLPPTCVTHRTHTPAMPLAPLCSAQLSCAHCLVQTHTSCRGSAAATAAALICRALLLLQGH
jgi:hypothetical protein